MKNLSVIEYGMSIVAKSLSYVRRGDFEGLKVRIHQEIYDKFGADVLKLEKDQETIKQILKNAAVRLSESLLLVDRLMDAANIFKYLGFEEEAKKTMNLYQVRYNTACSFLNSEGLSFYTLD